MKSKLIISIIIIKLFDISCNKTECPSGPQSRNDCFTISGPDFYCCYDPSNLSCKNVSKTELKNYKNLDCGITDDNYGKYEFGEYHPEQKFNLGFQTCGKYNPKSKKDCLEYSEIGNSCCYFNNETDKACLAIGKRHIGKGQIEFENKIYRYECNSFSIIINIIFSFFLIILQL